MTKVFRLYLTYFNIFPVFYLSFRKKKHSPRGNIFPLSNVNSINSSINKTSKTSTYEPFHRTINVCTATYFTKLSLNKNIKYNIQKQKKKKHTHTPHNSPPGRNCNTTRMVVACLPTHTHDLSLVYR